MLKTAAAGEEESYRYGRPGQKKNNAIRQEFLTVKERLNAANANYDSRAPGRSERDAIKTLRISVIEAKGDLSKANDALEAATEKKEAAGKIFKEAKDEDDKAAKAQKDEDKAAKKEGRAAKSIHTEEIKSARTKAAFADNNAKTAFNSAKTAATKARKVLIAVEARLEAFRALHTQDRGSRSSSGNHSGGRRYKKN